MSSGAGRKIRWLQDLILMAAAPVSAYFLVRYVLSRLDPEAERKAEVQKKSAAILRRLNAPILREEGSFESGEVKRLRKEDLALNQYEQAIAMEVVAPEDIPVSFEEMLTGIVAALDIGGLTEIIEELRESVIYPLTMPHLYSHTSALLSAPSGVLLFGPPGCGKTMLAKALAHESGATFINLHISTLTEKWYGDSNKMVNAVFSLAGKLQPSIVFIDEIDAVLGTRRSGEHEANGMLKAEFMTLWDGLTSANTSGLPERILILGATNRIQDIDEAILRRMPKKFPVSLPSAGQRLRILGLVLRDTKIDKKNFDADYLVRVMAGMSGSDIKEACRDAAMSPVREFLRNKRESGERMTALNLNPEEIRGLRTEDFFKSAGGSQLDNRMTPAPTTDSETSEVDEMEDTTESMD